MRACMSELARTRRREHVTEQCTDRCRRVAYPAQLQLIFGFFFFVVVVSLYLYNYNILTPAYALLVYSTTNSLSSIAFWI